MSLARNREVVKAENVKDGEGYILRDMLLSGDQFHGKLFYLSTITLDPGCSIGLHKHEDESEMFFIYEGEALYFDNDEQYRVYPGDSVFCAVGEQHGILNDTDKPMKFVAAMQEA